MNIRRAARTVLNLGRIAGMLAGSVSAPPPANLPRYLEEQYQNYAKTRPAEIRREISSLITKSRESTTSLTK